MTDDPFHISDRLREIEARLPTTEKLSWQTSSQLVSVAGLKPRLEQIESQLQNLEAKSNSNFHLLGIVGTVAMALFLVILSAISAILFYDDYSLVATSAFQCPVQYDIHDAKAAWVSFGCIGQIGSQANCVNYYWPLGGANPSQVEFPCEKITMYTRRRGNRPAT